MVSRRVYHSPVSVICLVGRILTEKRMPGVYDVDSRNVSRKALMWSTKSPAPTNRLGFDVSGRCSMISLGVADRAATAGSGTPSESIE